MEPEECSLRRWWFNWFLNYAQFGPLDVPVIALMFLQQSARLPTTVPLLSGSLLVFGSSSCVLVQRPWHWPFPMAAMSVPR